MERQDKERILRIADFLKSELADFKSKFLKIDFKAYSQNPDKRRNLERCIENIVNSSLDIAKIILVVENLSVPDTYREYFFRLFEAKIISESTAAALSQNVKLRNILAHQYLDIRWKNIQDFLSSGWKVYQDFIKIILKY